MNTPAAVIFDNLSGFARECLSIADDACEKLAATTEKLKAAEARREPLVLTKVAAIEIPINRVAETVDRMISKDFVKRSNRTATIEGIKVANREELFAILEKFATVAICPVSTLHRDDDGESVEKSATDGSSDSEDVWTRSWREANAEA